MRGLWAFFLVSIFSNVQAQTISEIRFSGLNRTKTEYVEAFVNTRVGDQVDEVRLEEDRQRLANLEVLSDAGYSVDVNGESALITFECRELFTLLPIFNFGSIEENFWFQIGGSEANLLGRGYKLSSYYQYYDRSSFATHLSFDRINGSSCGFNFNFIKWGTLEPLFFESGTVEYNYDNYTFGVDGIFHFNFFDRVLLGGAYFTENYEASSALVEGAPAQANTRKMLGKLILTRYKTNSFYFYRFGYSNDLVMETVQSLDGDDPFYIAFNDLKYFARIGRYGNFATRFRVGLSSNQVNPFAPFVLDSYLNIRGIGNRVDRGTGSIVLNTEYRHSIWDREIFAVQVVGFIDAGTWRLPGDDISTFTEQDNQVYFGGFGARFIHKKIYNAIFRVDYGFDLKEVAQNGWVLGIGQYF